jgi:hypothetical protein
VLLSAAVEDGSRSSRPKPIKNRQSTTRLDERRTAGAENRNCEPFQPRPRRPPAFSAHGFFSRARTVCGVGTFPARHPCAIRARRCPIPAPAITSGPRPKVSRVSAMCSPRRWWPPPWCHIELASVGNLLRLLLMNSAARRRSRRSQFRSDVDGRWSLPTSFLRDRRGFRFHLFKLTFLGRHHRRRDDGTAAGTADDFGFKFRLCELPLETSTSRTRLLLDAAPNRGVERKKKIGSQFGPDVGRPTSVWDHPG